MLSKYGTLKVDIKRKMNVLSKMMCLNRIFLYAWVPCEHGKWGSFQRTIPFFLVNPTFHGLGSKPGQKMNYPMD